MVIPSLKTIWNCKFSPEDIFPKLEFAPRLYIYSCKDDPLVIEPILHCPRLLMFIFKVDPLVIEPIEHGPRLFIFICKDDPLVIEPIVDGVTESPPIPIVNEAAAMKLPYDVIPGKYNSILKSVVNAKLPVVVGAGAFGVDNDNCKSLTKL
jgi:hypothetical protein